MKTAKRTLGVLLACALIGLTACFGSGEDDPTTASEPPAQNQGETKRFQHGELILEISNVAHEETKTALDHGTDSYDYTIYTIYPGARLTVINADMLDGSRTENGLPRGRCYIYDASKADNEQPEEYVFLTDDMPPFTITPDMTHVGINMVGVLRFEMVAETAAPESTLTQTTTESLNPSAAEGASQSQLPTYTPGSIQLTPNGISGDFEFAPTKRRLYYNIPGPFSSLAPEGTMDELFEKDKDIYSEPQEMALVTLVKRCNISRQNFEKTVDEYIEMCASARYDTAHEDFEIPNTDIIYTFDNEIINEYYRRG